MAESLTTKFIEFEKKHDVETYESLYDSSEYHPDHFGVGAVTGKVFEEIYDTQDEWETFFTMMFFLGIFLIPLQLIFADDIKPYDVYVIEKIQINFIYTNFFIEYCLTGLIRILLWTANLKFFLSVTVFFYLCFDPGVAFKTSLIAGCGSYIVFILKVISHDSRPFWISDNIEPGLCKLTFGSPSLDVLVGMLYSHYIFFCTDRALKSNDDIINLNRSAIQVSKYVSIMLMILNAFVGIAYFCLGVNFIYQILISFFYGFIIIRIIIIFNKDIDHFANGSRFIKQISNVSTIMIMFFTIILATISCIIYEIINPELLIPREWSDNISNHCTDSRDSTEMSIKLTFLDSTAIFNILGAVIGVNYVLKNIDNRFYWFITPWWQRLIRGIIGFIINLMIVNLTEYVRFISVTANFMLYSLIYSIAGFVLYGIMPIVYSYIGLTDQIYIKKKRDNMKSKKFINSINTEVNNKYNPIKSENEDERLSR